MIETIECDLLVIGAGMAGLSAAGYAAEHGANVIVLEKAERFGGSALLSGGVLWTARRLTGFVAAIAALSSSRRFNMASGRSRNRAPGRG